MMARLVTGSLYVLLVTVVLAIVVTEYRKHHAERLISLAQNDYPLIGHFSAGVPPSWVPLPWKLSDLTPARIVDAVLAQAQDNLQRADLQELDGRTEANTARYIRRWAVFVSLCDYVNATRSEADVSSCSNAASYELGQMHRDAFLAHLDGEWFIDPTGYVPTLMRRTRVTEAVCSIAPIPMIHEAAIRFTEPKTAEFYARRLNIDVSTGYKTPALTVHPGACDLVEIPVMLRPDTTSNMRSRSTEQNVRLKTWFIENYGRYHRPEVLEAAFTLGQGLSEQAEFERHGASHCIATGRGHSGGFFEYGLQSCSASQSEDFVESQVTAGFSTVHIAFLPEFQDARPILQEPDPAQSRYLLNDARRAAEAWAPMVSDQFAKWQRWRDKEPRFFLTRDDTQFVKDENGPFAVGVSLSQIPQTTILGEALDIPSRGSLTHLYALSPDARKQPGEFRFETQIWSKYDLYDALSQHGSRRDLGIQAYLGVDLVTPHGTSEIYAARHRFNGRTWQEFDTSSGFWDGFLHGFAFGTGDWIQQQQYAYARQFHATEFFWGETLSFFLPVGPTILRSFGRIGRVSKSARLLSTLRVRVLSGLAEGGLGYGYQIATAPGLQPEQRTQYLAETDSKLSFAFGFLFPPSR